MNLARDKFGRYKRTIKRWSLKRFNEGHVNNKGRFMVYAPDHPRSYESGYMLRSIIAYESYNKTKVPVGFNIHHKDHNRLNDSKENLEMLDHKEHAHVHNPSTVEYVTRSCTICRGKFLIKKWRLKDPSRGKYCTQDCYKKRGKK